MFAPIISSRIIMARILLLDYHSFSSHALSNWRRCLRGVNFEIRRDEAFGDNL